MMHEDNDLMANLGEKIEPSPPKIENQDSLSPSIPRRFGSDLIKDQIKNQLTLQ